MFSLHRPGLHHGHYYLASAKNQKLETRIKVKWTAG
jgi:hypothetical protein